MWIILWSVLSCAQSKTTGNLDFRADYWNQAPFQTTSRQDDFGQSRFLIQRARLAFEMEAASKAQIALRMNLLQNPQPLASSTLAYGSAVEGATDFLDYFYVQAPLGQGLSVQAGKLVLKTYGSEGLISSADQYLRSLAFQNAYQGASNPQQYRTGLGFIWRLQDSEGGLQLINADYNTSASSANLNPRRSGYGFYWELDFADHFIRPRLSWYEMPGPRSAIQREQEIDHDYLALGFSLQGPASWVFDLDYLSNRHPQRSQEGQTDQEASTLLVVRKMAGTYRPQLKIESSVVQLAGAESFRRLSWAPALEYFPYSSESLRYHLALSWVTDTYRDSNLANTQVKQTNIFAGVRWQAPFLNLQTP